MANRSSAADLPDGSVVAAERTTYVKDHPSPTAQWRGTRGGYHRNGEVDEAIANGAQVLRVGSESTADVEMLERIREWASMYPTLPPEVVAQVYEFKTLDLEMATVERVRYLLAGGTYRYLRRDSEGNDRD